MSNQKPVAADNDDGSETLSTTSSLSLPSCLSYQLSPETQNPSQVDDQTLEASFARLSVNSFTFDPLDFDRDESNDINGAVNTAVFDRHGFRHHHHHHQSSNLGQGWNNSGSASSGSAASQISRLSHHRDRGNSNGVWHGSSNGTYGASSGYNSSTHDRFLDSEPPVRQNGFGRGFSGAPLSNGGSSQLLQNSGGSALDELLGNGLSVAGLNGGNERPDSWFRGRVLYLAKDRYGHRILKEKIERLRPHEVPLFFFEMINDIVALMVDPYGNEVIQKMVPICSEQQRTIIISMVTKDALQLVRICLNPHGIRSVEKLLDHVTTREQRALIVSSLRPGAVALAKDINGHRAILHCVKHFSQEESKYLLSAFANNCFGIATDKTGCCMLIDCLKYGQGETKVQMIAELTVNASYLADDCYGNYVLQQLLCLKIHAVTDNILRQLEGSLLYLSCSKYGSNVVEKFFENSGEQHNTRIILELLNNPNVAMLLIHPYGNFVIQSALKVSKGAIRSALMQLIQVNSPAMRCNLFGKKVLAKFAKLRSTT